MPNYEIFTNFVFCRSYFKKERFPAIKKRKTENAVVSVAIEFGVSRQTSKQMARELCRNNIFCVATPDLKIGR